MIRSWPRLIVAAAAACVTSQSLAQDLCFTPVDSAVSGAATTLNAVTFGAARFVAVGTNGNVITLKADTAPLEWRTTNIISGSNGKNLRAVAFGANRFIAGGANSGVFSSADGTAWQFRSEAFPTKKDVTGLLQTDSTAVSVGDIVDVRRSADLSSWSPSIIDQASFFEIYRGITSFRDTQNKTRWIIVGGAGVIRVSDDNGATWKVATTNSFGSGVSLFGVASGAGKLVAVGASGRIRVSTDGLQWTSITQGTANLNAVTYAPEIGFVAVGDGGALYTSADAATWTSRNSGTTQQLLGVAASNDGLVMAVGAGGTVVLGSVVPSITIQPAAQIVCAGASTITFSVEATGQSLTYRWQKDGQPLADGANVSGVTTATLTLTGTSKADVGKYQVMVTGAAPCSIVSSTEVALTVNDPPVIATQPEPSKTACAPSAVTLTVNATGDGLTYQWRKNGQPLVDGGNVSGATTPTLTLAATTAADAGSYDVVVSGAAPCNPATSNASTVIVNLPPTITAQPAPTQTVCAPGSASFTVGATGTGLTYQWRKAGVDLADGETISGATTATLTIHPTRPEDAGAYNVVVRGAAPCAPAISSGASLTVNLPPAITTQPQASQTNCAPAAVSFKVEATGTGLTYQWRKNGQPITDGGAISGATTATLTLNQTSSGDAATYDVVVNGAAPCSSATSGPAVLIVNLPPTITNQPETNQVVCAGMPASFLVDATGTGLTYQWRKDGTNLVDGGHITGATTATLDIGPTSAEDSGSYEVVVTGAGPCTSATSAPAKLVVNLPPAITVQPQTNVTICMPGPASFHVEATGTDLTYRWRKNAQPLVDGGNVSGATTATLTLTATSPQDAATYDVIVSAASPCSTVTSAAGTLQVNKAPTIIVQPDVNQEVCAGTSAIFIVDAAGDGLTYQWRKGGVNIVDSTNIIGATTATLSIEPASESDSGAYDVVISGRAACSNVVSTVANLSVNVPPSITTQPQAPPTACTNASISLSVTAAGTDLIYQWRKDGTNLANDGHISGATNATLTINPASTPDAGSYDVVIKGSAACSKTVTSTPVTVSVSEPITIIEQPRGGKFCFSGVATLSVKATGTGLTYQWLKNGTNLINGGNISGATNATLTIDSPSEADNGNYQVVVTATPCGSITSETAELKGGVCLNYRVIRDQQSQVTDIEFTWTSSAPLQLQSASRVDADGQDWKTVYTGTAGGGTFVQHVGTDAEVYYRLAPVPQ